MSKSAILVREYMTPAVVAVDPPTPLDRVLAKLREHDISSVVVAGPEGDAVGVVSMTDLLRASTLEHGRAGERLKVMPPSLTAKDVMRTPVFTVRDDAPVSEAAALLRAHRVHRLFVTSGDGVVGVFSTRDAMRVVRVLKIAIPVGQLMSTPVVTVDIGESIDDALERLDDRDMQGVVVVDGKRPVGVFTQHEAILARALPAELRKTARVEEVTSYEIITADVATPLYRAAAQVMATRARRVLATEDHELRGVLTGYDVSRVLADR